MTAQRVPSRRGRRDPGGAERAVGTGKKQSRAPAGRAHRYEEFPDNHTGRRLPHGRELALFSGVRCPTDVYGPKAARRSNQPRARDQATVLAHQRRRRPAPLLDARGDRRNLRIRVGPGIFRVWDQPVDRPPLDLVGRPRPLISVAISRARARAPRERGRIKRAPSPPNWQPATQHLAMWYAPERRPRGPSGPRRAAVPKELAKCA
jgi:hypothetical protein